MPVSRTASPAIRRAWRPAPPSRRSRWACRNEPRLQLSEAALITSPAWDTLKPRSSVSASGMNASQPRNATASSPRTAIPDGSPRAARSVPAGSSARSAGSPERGAGAAQEQEQRQRIAVQPGEEERHARRPARAPCGSRRPGRVTAGGRSSARRPGSVSATATGRNGSSSTNTQRHVVWSATSPAIGGPGERRQHPGGGHQREHPPVHGRRVGAARRGVGDDDERSRAESLEHPSGEQHVPGRRERGEHASGGERAHRPRYARTGPARSASCPAATEPTRLASMNALNAQP